MTHNNKKTKDILSAQKILLESLAKAESNLNTLKQKRLTQAKENHEFTCNLKKLLYSSTVNPK